jgi:GMP reductase
VRIVSDVKLDFCDVLIQPKRSRAVSRADVDLNRKFKFLNSTSSWEGVFPLISSNMAATGTMALAKALGRHGALTALHKYYSVEELVEFYNKFPGLVKQNVFYTLGIKDEDFEKLDKIASKLKYEISAYNLDVANAYTDAFIDAVKRLRKMVGDMPVILAGNVCSSDMVQEILFAGADIVKIGIGSGSQCLTRRIAGVGACQLSAVIDCADVAHGIGGLVCSDGGCREPGDVVKAFAAGGDFVCLGGMFAGVDENEGDWTYWEHKPEQKKAFKFFGMSSREANNTYNGGLKDYRAAEGRCEYIPYKGPVDRIMQEIMGGIRSACTYVGTTKLKDLSKCTTFTRVPRIHI